MIPNHKLPKVLLKIGVYSSILYPSLIDVILLNLNQFVCVASNTVLSSNSSIRVPEMKNPPIVIPASAKHTATIIFLHSYHQTGETWSKKIEEIRQPYMKVICPTANTIPLKWFMGMKCSSWFDFGGLQGLPRIGDEDNENEGLDEATIYIHHLIETEIKNGIPPGRIILAGVQQGGSLAFHSGVTFHKKLGGIITFSPWMPLKKTWNEAFNEANRDIPILQCHIHTDPYMDPYLVEVFENRTRKHVSKNFNMKIYNATEPVIPEEYEAMKEFCKRHVAPI